MAEMVAVDDVLRVIEKTLPDAIRYADGLLEAEGAVDYAYIIDRELRRAILALAQLPVPTKEG